MQAETGKKYRRYKGGEYKVIALAKDSETLQDVVVYQSLEHPERIWVRPKNMFEEQVRKEETTVDRFTLIPNEI